MTKPVRKVISDKASTTYKRWELPQVETGGLATFGPLTASQVELLQKQAYDEAFCKGQDAGFKQGYQQGLEQANVETHARLEQLKALLEVLAKPLDVLDDEVEASLVELTIAIARQLIRREIKASPGEIVAVAREAMRVLPLSSRNIRLHLHPEDASLVTEAMGQPMQQGGWAVVEDPTLTRGGCEVETDDSRVDATVETRLARVISNLFGGERGGD